MIPTTQPPPAWVSVERLRGRWSPTRTLGGRAGRVGGVVDLSVLTWNQIVPLLRDLEELRKA